MSKQKSSITDHFAKIPLKQIEKPLFPLFTPKKTSTTSNDENLKSKAIEPKNSNEKPESKVTVAEHKISKGSKRGLECPMAKQTSIPSLQQPLASKRMKRKSNTLLDQIIQSDTHTFFNTQKQKREKKKYSLSPPNSHKIRYDHKLTTKDIELQMNEIYKDFPWKKDNCCKALFDQLDEFASMPTSLMWKDKYRPSQVGGLVGYTPDYEYLRDWLNIFKIKDKTTTLNSKQRRPKKQTIHKLHGGDDLYNLILLVGSYGLGKTASVYTAAKETNYTIFEINSSSKRSGKCLAERVGEMTASHLVNFDLHKNHKKRTGETLIIKDTVRKKKPKFDMSEHFKKLMKVSDQLNETNKDDDAAESLLPTNTQTLDLYFKKKEPTKVDTSVKVKKDLDSFFTKKPQTNTVNEKSNKQKDPDIDTKDVEMREVDQHVIHQPFQSLLLLEEVDILFEEDKGFWPAVIDLCQKSKRPIIMTCNDDSHIPFDSLNIQSILYFDTPEKTSIIPYIQLICLAEGYIVNNSDILFLCELLEYDTRRIIDTLQFWLNDVSISQGEHHFFYKYLFAHIMGFADVLLISIDELMNYLKGLDSRTVNLCVNYYYMINSDRYKEESPNIENIGNMMNNASFSDAWIGLTKRQRHQIYDIDQYDNRDFISGANTLLLKEPKDLDHWELGEIIEKSISAIDLNQISNKIWRDSFSSWTAQWETLCDTRTHILEENIGIISPLMLLNESITSNRSIFMTEYMPNIRSMLVHDQGAAGRGRTERTRKKIKYIKLDNNLRDLIKWQPIE